MNIGFYTARSGVLTMQEGVDVVSNNISNVNTTGFKAIRTSFSDLLYTTQKPENPKAQTGHGVRNTKTDLMYKQGALMKTDRDLDFVALDDGFFAVQGNNQDISFTKDGSFYISKEGNDWYLVTAKGENVLNYDKTPIKIEKTKEGNVDGEKLMQNLGVFKFKNPNALEPQGNNKFNSTESSGDGVADKTLDKLTGALELSTIDLAEQMVGLMKFQRGLQVNAKMVQTADELENIVNNLR